MPLREEKKRDPLSPPATGFYRINAETCLVTATVAPSVQDPMGRRKFWSVHVVGVTITI